MLIPARSLVWLALVPLAFACLYPFDEGMLWPMLVADAGLAAIALIDALWALRGKVTLTRACNEVFSLGRANAVTVTLRSRAHRRLRVELGCELFDYAEADALPLSLELPARGRAVERFGVTPQRRGAFELGATVIRYPSPLGLWRRQQRFEGEPGPGTSVRVYPDVQAVRTWELLARQDRQHAYMRTTRKLGGESEFEQLRDYSRDDEFRSIDWKATARRGKLTARQYQLESNQNLMFVLDGGRLMTAHSDGISLFDHALNASLMLAHVASRGGDRVGLLSYAEEVTAFVPPGGGRRAVQKLIQASYALHPELLESDAERACALLNLRVRRRTMVVLFTSVIDERGASELLRVTRGLAGRHLPLIVLFQDRDLRGLLQAQPAAGAALHAGGRARAQTNELQLYTRGAAAEIVAWREQLLRQLEASGALVMHPDAGELTAELINRYLEIKARHLL